MWWLKSLIYLSIIKCVCVSAGDGYLLTSKHEIQPMRKKVAFGSSCMLFIDEQLKNELKGYEYNIKNNLPQACRSAMAWEFIYCATKHQEILEQLRKLPSSISMTRDKRDLSDVMLQGASYLVEKPSQAACVFIKGISSGSLASMVIEGARGLLTLITSRNQIEYNSKMLIPMDQIRKTISDVSIFANRRPEPMSSVIQSMNYEDTFLDYIHDEMRAALVLTRSLLLDHLNLGQLDTQGLGEFTNDQYLMEIDPKYH